MVYAVNGENILVVEDDSAIAQFVAASLSAAGYRPVSAGTAAMADAELARVRPQLVIADLGLPDRDGVAMIAQWRRATSGQWAAQVPVLVLSARTQEAEKIAALDAGADDYLGKPFGTGAARRRGDGRPVAL